MRTNYYNRMRFARVAVPMVALGMLLSSSPGAQQALPTGPAVESHDGLTISALPWTDPAQYKQKFPKKAPIEGGVIAIQVSFRNDTSESIKIGLERIRLTVLISDDNRQELRTLTSDQVADAALKPKSSDPTARRRLPLPVGSIGAGHDKKWTEMQKAAGDAAVAASVVSPHSTVQGLLYFDLQGQADLLSTAHLYVPELLAIEKNRQLLYFDIELSRRSGS